MTRLTSYIILSYCILTETEDTLSAKGNILQSDSALELRLSTILSLGLCFPYIRDKYHCSDVWLRML